MTVITSQLELSTSEQRLRQELDLPVTRSALREHVVAKVKKTWLISTFELNDLVDELVQQVCAKALAKECEYDFDKGTLAAWLHGLVNFTVLEHRRQYRSKVACRQADEGILEQIAAVERDKSKLDMRRDFVLSVLPRLAPLDQRLVQLHLCELMTNDEIARETGLSPGNTRTRLTRLRTKLRGWYLQHNPEDAS